MTTYDLHLLYPWLNRWAVREDGSVFARAYANADARTPGAWPKHVAVGAE